MGHKFWAWLNRIKIWALERRGLLFIFKLIASILSFFLLPHKPKALHEPHHKAKSIRWRRLPVPTPAPAPSPWYFHFLLINTTYGFSFVFC